MSYVHYWPVGSTNDIHLSLTLAQICRALLADWLPTLPFSASRGVLSWPYYLIVADTGVPRYLYLESIAGWSDRQWKMVLSWMLGVAGTRRVLDEEQYVWIAPSSAFYPNRRQYVAAPSWHTSYPPSVLQILPDPNNSSRLRPDYIAARLSASGSVEFALVESKGISSALNSIQVCPTSWADQVKNAIVRVNTTPVTIPRHLIVATRCNPNAVRNQTRRLQIRAWNSNSKFNTTFDNMDMLLEIASAHYFGLCKNLGLWANLRALRYSVLARRRRKRPLVSESELVEINQAADEELKIQGHLHKYEEKGAYFEITIDTGTIHIQVVDAAISFIRTLRSFAPMEKMNEEIVHHLQVLIDWYSKRVTEYKDVSDIAIDRSGFIVKTRDIGFPAEPNFRSSRHRL